jgi:hypothetical protein
VQEQVILLPGGRAARRDQHSGLGHQPVQDHLGRVAQVVERVPGDAERLDQVVVGLSLQ